MLRERGQKTSSSLLGVFRLRERFGRVEALISEAEATSRASRISSGSYSGAHEKRGSKISS